MCDAEKSSDDLVVQNSCLHSTRVGSITSLHSILELIIHQREIRTERILCHGFDSDIMNVHNVFWSDLFTQAFLSPNLENPLDGPGDDLLFFVHHIHQNDQKPELSVFRRNSPNLPKLVNDNIDWEETVYLNLLMQYFVYIVTVAVCTRTGPQEWQILRKFSQTVYASPSHRKMDMKGSYEQIVYPDLYFTIDNYEEAFSECVLRDSECLNVELTAYDRSGQAFGVCFLGTISYSTLKQFYDSSQTLQSSRHCSGQRNNRMTKSSYSCSSSIHNNNCPSIQFMRVIGPQAKGLAEIAIKPMESDYIIEQERQSLDLSKADYANSSDFIIKCCQPVCPSEIEIEYNSPDNYVLNDMNMKNKTKHSKVITQQPITESCKSASLLNFYESLLGINPKSDEPAHLQNTYINPIPTLYPSPWSVKSAGASVHTSPVRWSKRKVGSKCSTQPVSQQELSPTLNRRLQFKSTNAINLLNESKPSRVSEILNAFTGTVKKQSSDIHPTKSLQINVDNPTGKRSSMNNTKAVLFPMKKDDNESADRLKSLSIHEDACTDHLYENPFLSTDRGSSSFGQAWSWFKEKRRAISIALNASPTFITLPCQSVLVDLLEVRREPILNFSNR